MADNYVIKPESLERPFSFFRNGRQATLRRRIAATASTFVLEDFGIAAEKLTIRPIIDLKNKARKTLALSELKAAHASSPNELIPVTGFGSYTPARLIDEVTRNTPMGKKTVEGVIFEAMLIESKIERSHIRPSMDVKQMNRQPV